MAGCLSLLKLELGVIMSKPFVGQKMFLTQFGYSKPRYYEAEVTKLGRKYFEVTVNGYRNLTFQIAEKRGVCWHQGDRTLWESKTAYTDFRHAENLKSTLKNSLDTADLQRLASFAKFMGVFVEYPVIDT